MSETNNYNIAWKDRLRWLGFLAVIFTIVLAINESLWLIDKIIIASIITALVPIKFFVIIFRIWRLWISDNKKIITLLIGLLLFVSAFLFDIDIVPQLWAYRLGTETQGKAIEFRIKSKNTHFITYEFTVDESVYREEQQVTIPFYESLKSGDFVSVRYLSNAPGVSFLVDPKQLKFQTLFTFFTGLGIIFALYINEIEGKIKATVQSALQSIKPA